MFFTQMAFGYIQPYDDEPIQIAVKRVFLAPDYSEFTFIENMINELNCYISYGTIFMTIPFAVLNILDGGLQIQRWPMPVILGSFYGHIFGIVVGTFVALYRLNRLRWRKRDWEQPTKPSPTTKRMV
jgi:membrane associated rhomboid family serine protease